MPFQENDMGDCPEKFLEFHNTEDEYLEEWNKNESTVTKEQYESIIKSKEYVLKGFNVMFLSRAEEDNRWRVFYRDEKTNDLKGEAYIKIVSKKEKEIVDEHDRVRKVHDLTVVTIDPPIETKIQEAYKDFEEYAKDYHGAETRDEKNGKFGYWENPNAKWDWYQLGGRWTGFFKLKPGKEGEIGAPGLMTSKAEVGYVDQAYKKDIDFAQMKRNSFEKASNTYDLYEEKVKNDPEYKGSNAYFEYGINNTGTRENHISETRQEYLARLAPVTTLALLKDGKWYERGEMGWWGVVSDEKAPNEWSLEFEKLLEECPNDTLLSVYDCHI